MAPAKKSNVKPAAKKHAPLKSDAWKSGHTGGKTTAYLDAVMARGERKKVSSAKRATKRSVKPHPRGK